MVDGAREVESSTTEAVTIENNLQNGNLWILELLF